MDLRTEVNTLITSFNKQMDDYEYLRAREEEQAKKDEGAIIDELSKEIVSDEQQKIQEQKKQVILKRSDVQMKKLTGQVIEQPGEKEQRAVVDAFVTQFNKEYALNQATLKQLQEEVPKLRTTYIQQKK